MDLDSLYQQSRFRSVQSLILYYLGHLSLIQEVAAERGRDWSASAAGAGSPDFKVSQLLLRWVSSTSLLPPSSHHPCSWDLAISTIFANKATMSLSSCKPVNTKALNDCSRFWRKNAPSLETYASNKSLDCSWTSQTPIAGLKHTNNSGKQF